MKIFFTLSKKNNKLIFLIVLFFSINLFSQTPDPTIKLLSPNGSEYWTNGSFPRITWKAVNTPIVKVEISIDAGVTWETITPATIGATGLYDKWRLIDIESDECLVRVSKFDNPDIYDISESYFKITSDSSSQNLVVLGSSTAAGVGPSTIDSAWVTRYANYLFEKNTTIQVKNLAVGGYTTYELMPSDFIPIVNRPLPSEGHNITKAITYNPKALIINLPSNDVDFGFTITEQLANYDTMLSIANYENIPVWITTTQPRNFIGTKIAKQIEMRDSTYARFGNRTLDFWTDLADSTGRIASEFDSGDGVHLNDSAHFVLFSRVVAANIFDPTVVSVKESEEIFANFELMQNYPNPFNPTTTIKYRVPHENVNSFATATLQLKVFDILGREVATLVKEKQSPGIYEVVFDGSNFSSGVYFYRLESSNFIQTKKLMLVK